MGANKPSQCTTSPIHTTHAISFWCSKTLTTHPHNTPIWHLKSYIERIHMPTSNYNRPPISICGEIVQQSPSILKHFQLLLVFPKMHQHSKNHSNTQSTIRSIHGWPKEEHQFAHLIPNPLCDIWPLRFTNTYIHLISMSTNPIINDLRTSRHNKVVWQIYKFLPSHPNEHHPLWLTSKVESTKTSSPK